MSKISQRNTMSTDRMLLMARDIPQRVDGFDPEKILLVIGDYNAAVHLGDRSDDRVERASRLTLRFRRARRAGRCAGRWRPSAVVPAPSPVPRPARTTSISERRRGIR